MGASVLVPVYMRLCVQAHAGVHSCEHLCVRVRVAFVRVVRFVRLCAFFQSHLSITCLQLDVRFLRQDDLLRTTEVVVGSAVV